MINAKHLSTFGSANWALVCAMAITAACGSKHSSSGSPASGGDESTIEVDTSSADLSKRLSVENQSIPVDSGTASLDLVSVVTLIQVGVVTPPTVGGALVQANSVAMNGTTAYVSYNMAGDAGSGGIDSISTLIPALPVITSSLTSTTSDFNGVAQSGSNLYVVGENPTATNTAFLMTIGLTTGFTPGLLTSTTATYNLPSYAGNDVTVGSSNVYATSGSGGGLTTFTTSTMAQVNYTAINDARSVRVNPNDNTVRVLSGQPGTLTSLTAAGITPIAKALGGAATAQSKSTVSVGTQYTTASLGEGGFDLICTATSAVLASVPQVTISGQTAANTVTNAVATIGNLVFTANGQAGVYVYSITPTNGATPCPAVTLTPVGSLNFGAALSANAVYAAPGLLFVVDGLGGLRILTVLAL